jgi:2-iminobutanoate/2-iminopropanoate deaminase
VAAVICAASCRPRWCAGADSDKIHGLFAESEKEVASTVRQTVATKSAPGAIGPYSQAVVAGGFVFASGQIPLDPATGEFVAGGVAEQTEQVLRNLTEVLKAAGCGLEDVVKTTVFLADMNDFAAMNEAYGRYFKIDPPARSTVQAARLPRDARVEIDVVAIKRDEG